MIDLTPLDVRKKRGDFGKGVRGYNTQEVDTFLELAAERLEELVKENLQLRERVDRLAEQVTAQTERERAVHEALVTAQQLREEIHGNAQKEAQLVLQEAQAQAREILGEAERKALSQVEALHELERRRSRFLASFRQYLERELEDVAAEENRPASQSDVVVELDLRGGRPVGLDPRPADDVHALAEDDVAELNALADAASAAETPAPTAEELGLHIPDEPHSPVNELDRWESTRLPGTDNDPRTP